MEARANDAPHIVLVDEHCLVADKPDGLPAVPGRPAELHDCLASRVQRHRAADARVVHRLDMATSGLMLFARGLAAQRRLARAFEAREVDKVYVAVVAGHFADEEGTIATPIGADWADRPRRKVDTTSGKPAVTPWRVLARDAQTTRVELRPRTGRTHQLRVHLASIGHPIVGDTLYAGPPAPRLLLHAAALAFAHPHDGRRIAVESPPPF